MRYQHSALKMEKLCCYKKNFAHVWVHVNLQVKILNLEGLSIRNKNNFLKNLF